MKAARLHTRGFSLLEVLIAVVIMSVGLLALATLQASIIRSSSESKAQTIALNLAKDKLEDLMTYRVLNASAACNVDSTDSYQCIDSGTDTIADTQGVFSSGGSAYTRTWTVTRCVGLTGAFTCGQVNTDDSTTSTPRNEFKAITVNVSWPDAQGTSPAPSVTVVDAVGALQPSDIALIGKKPVKLSPRYAKQKIYNPASEAGVIPIAVGSNTNSAATNPKPEVVVGTSVVETRFDVLTYAGLVGDATVTAQSRVETSMIGCTCDYAAAPISTSTVRGFRPTYWDGTRYIAPDTAAYVPKAGVGNATQSSKCTICCRDHHDPAGVSGATFAPYVVSHPTVTTEHPHYNSSAVGSTPVTTGTYREACRLIRVDGIFRVASDLNEEYFGLLATKDLSDPTVYASLSVPDTTAVTAYQSFVVNYMNSRFTNVSAGNASDVSQSPYNTVLTTTAVANLEAGVTPSINAPSSITIDAASALSKKWSHARGLYVDFLEREAMDALETAKDNCVDGLNNPYPTNSVDYSQCVLKVLPFTTVNLTEIADWDTRDSANAQNSTHIQVSNNDFYTASNFSEPQRGKVTKGGGTPVAGTVINVNAFSRKHNTGLLDLSFNSISPLDDELREDKQPYLIATSAVVSSNPNNGIFKVNLVMSPPATPAYAYTYTGTPYVTYTTGSLTPQDCIANTSLTNSCVVNNGTPSAGIGVADSMSIDVGLYTREVTGTSKDTITCSNTFNNVTTTESYTPANNEDPYPATYCYNYTLTSATKTGAGTATIGTTTGNGDKLEKTNVSFSLLNKEAGNPLVYDTVTLTFGLGTGDSGITKAPPASCSFQCEKKVSGIDTIVSCSTNGSKKTYFVTPAAHACTGF